MPVAPGVEYMRTRTVPGEAGDRLFYDTMYSDYEKWCQTNGKIQMTRRKFFPIFSGKYATTSITGQTGQTKAMTAFKGLRIKGESLHIAVITRQRSSKTNPLDTFLRFYSEHLRGKEMMGPAIVNKYRDYLRRDGLEDSLGHREIYLALERMGAIKKINGRGFIYKMS